MKSGCKVGVDANTFSVCQNLQVGISYHMGALNSRKCNSLIPDLILYKFKFFDLTLPEEFYYFLTIK